MSIPIEKLSLSQDFAPLRQTVTGNSVPSGGGFSEAFDKALGGVETPASNATVKARELAQKLTMQMLQSSLALAGDYQENGNTASGTTRFSTVNALLEAYRTNLPAEGVPDSAPSSPPSTQLNDLAKGFSELPAAVLTTRTHTDTAWLDPIILNASRKYGVDAGLIKAVIKAESDFNPQAVSHAGARGLMQLMPATARSLGVGDSFDPEQNVMGGTRFLKDMLHRYNGNVDAALAAYNWGPGNVDKRPDHLPRETRDYLVRVKQLYASYSA